MLNLKPSLLRLTAQCQQWNQMHPVPTPVLVRLDSGDVRLTETRSAAEVLSGTAVIWLKGIVGCYALDRVAALPPRTKATYQKIYRGLPGSATAVGQLLQHGGLQASVSYNSQRRTYEVRVPTKQYAAALAYLADPNRAPQPKLMS